MSEHYPFATKPLDYEYIALTPYLDPNTIYIHHNKIYTMYVDTMNYLLSFYPQYQNWPLEDLIFKRLQVPVAAENTIKHTAGGIYHHNLFFEGMSPGQTGNQNNALTHKLTDSYGSMENFQRLFRQAAFSIQGCGWVWLAGLTGNDEVRIITSQNNLVPSTEHFSPLLVLDSWEHAYFLLYPAQMGSFINNWFHIINWTIAEQRYLAYRNKTA